MTKEKVKLNEAQQRAIKFNAARNYQSIVSLINSNEQMFEASRSFANANDAAIFLVQQLTAVESEIINLDSNMFKFRQILPVKVVGGGAEAIEHYERRMAGKAAFVGETQTNRIPTADVRFNSTQGPVKHLGIKYGWDIFELAKMLRARLSLDTERAMAAREGMEAMHNDIFWYGDQSRNLKGVLSTDHLKLVTGLHDWSSATAAEIESDCLKVINAVADETNDELQADRLVVYPGGKRILEQKARSQDTSISIAQFLLQNTTVREIVDVRELIAPDLLSNKPGLMAQSLDPMAAAYQEPVPFTVMPVQQQGFSYDVNCYSDTGGVTVYKKYFGSIGEVGA